MNVVYVLIVISCNLLCVINNYVVFEMNEIVVLLLIWLSYSFVVCWILVLVEVYKKFLISYYILYLLFCVVI